MEQRWGDTDDAIDRIRIAFQTENKAHGNMLMVFSPYIERLGDRYTGLTEGEAFQRYWTDLVKSEDLLNIVHTLVATRLTEDVLVY